MSRVTQQRSSSLTFRNWPQHLADLGNKFDWFWTITNVTSKLLSQVCIPRGSIFYFLCFPQSKTGTGDVGEEKCEVSSKNSCVVIIDCDITTPFFQIKIEHPPSVSCYHLNHFVVLVDQYDLIISSYWYSCHTRIPVITIDFDLVLRHCRGISILERLSSCRSIFNIFNCPGWPMKLLGSWMVPIIALRFVVWSAAVTEFIVIKHVCSLFPAADWFWSTTFTLEKFSSWFISKAGNYLLFAGRQFSCILFLLSGTFLWLLTTAYALNWPVASTIASAVNVSLVGIGLATFTGCFRWVWMLFTSPIGVTQVIRLRELKGENSV